MTKGELKKKLNVKNVLLLLISIFVVWNFSWYLVTTIRYHEFVKAVPKNEIGTYVKKEDGYIFNVRKPSYLHYTGNLGVSSLQNKVSLIIWPQIFGGYKYGIRIQDDDKVYEIYVDGNMKPISKENSAIIDKYNAKVEKLSSIAKEMWPALE